MEASAAALLHRPWPGGCADYFYRISRLCRPQARGAKRQSSKSVQRPRRHAADEAETAQHLRQPPGSNTLGFGVASAGAVVARSARQRHCLGGALSGKRGQPQGKRAVSHRIAENAGNNVVGRAPSARASAPERGARLASPARHDHRPAIRRGRGGESYVDSMAQRSRAGRTRGLYGCAKSSTRG